MATRTVLALSDEALEIIGRRAPSENKRGAWVSTALVEYDELLKAQELSDPARLARIENDVTEIKAQLAKLLAKE